MEIKRRRFARKKEIASIRERIASGFENLARTVSRKEKVEVGETEESLSLILINGMPYFFEWQGRYFPHLKAILSREIEARYAVVDMGAVAHVVNGADIMRPGVVEVSRNIEKGKALVVLEESHRKPIALGISLWGYESFQRLSRGKCIKNLHHVEDKLWKVEV